MNSFKLSGTTCSDYEGGELNIISAVLFITLFYVYSVILYI